MMARRMAAERGSSGPGRCPGSSMPLLPIRWGWPEGGLGDQAGLAVVRDPQPLLGYPVPLHPDRGRRARPGGAGVRTDGPGGALLMPFALRAPALPRCWRWLLLVVYTLVEILGPWLLLGHAETRLTSSTTGLVIAVVPIVAAIILTVMGQDRLGRRRIPGLLIGLAGVALLLGLDVHAGDLVAIGEMLWWSSATPSGGSSSVGSCLTCRPSGSSRRH